MEIKAELKKPYTDKQRADFIVENNHNHGYEIQETDEALLAVYNEPLPPTKEEVSETRRQLYIAEKDPITCQIQALRDEEQTEEIMAQIESLKEERARVVERIKAENPYPQEAEAKNETGNI